MASNKPATIVSGMPGGEDCGGRAGARPIDLAHLRRQTMGDRALEREVLALFVQQALTVRDGLAKAAGPETGRLAHALKGSARGVGAFAIADCAAEIEDAPHDRRPLRRLARLIDEMRDFIAAIHR